MVNSYNLTFKNYCLTVNSQASQIFNNWLFQKIQASCRASLNLRLGVSADDPWVHFRALTSNLTLFSLSFLFRSNPAFCRRDQECSVLSLLAGNSGLLQIGMYANADTMQTQNSRFCRCDQSNESAYWIVHVLDTFIPYSVSKLLHQRA